MALLTRRDFLNNALIASSVPGLGANLWTNASAREGPTGVCDGEIGLDPRALRRGNLPSSFNVAHWLRDRRLQFGQDAVTLASGCDGIEGRLPIVDDGEVFDVIVVGAGLSGLTAAFCLLRARPDLQLLILDANAHPGGNATRDEGPPLPVPASTAGSYCSAPSTEFQRDLFRELAIDWERYRIAAPLYSYYFDETTPGILPGSRGWNIDTYGEGLGRVPYPATIVADLLRCRDEFRRWATTEGGPTDPPERSHPHFDRLAAMTLDDYLTRVLRCDPAVADFYSRYTIDALGGTTAQVNAHSGLSFLGAEYGDLIAFPGGTAELAVSLVRWLTRPRPSNGRDDCVALRLNSVALRIDAPASLSNGGAAVTYFAKNAFRRATARSVILACQSHSARHLVAHLSDSKRRDAWQALNTVPVVVANVAIRRAAPLIELGLGYNQYWWGSRYWADFVVADWTTMDRTNPDRPTVLTFLSGNSVPPEGLAGERQRLLTTPFRAYEESLKEDLSRLLRGTVFDFDRDVTSISLYRWGHGMIMPTVGSVFGDQRGATSGRGGSVRRLAFARLGPISFAGQDSEGTPSVESAMASAQRAADEVLANL